MIDEPEDSRVLLLDIESAPIIGFAWGFYDTNLLDTLRDWTILCYAAQWIIDGVPQKPFVHSIKRPKDLFSFIQNPNNDEDLTHELWELLNGATHVCAHNGNSFDIKKINSRFLYYGLGPPSPYQKIDTLRAVKAVSANTRNNQGILLREWGIGFKMDNEGFPLWLKCMGGEREAWKTMEAYNLQDVVGLSQLYKKLLPWMKSNRGMYAVGTACGHCGSHELQSRGKDIKNSTWYKRIFCKSCKGWNRAPLNEQESKPIVAL